MVSSCGRCYQLGFPSELNRYPEAASIKRHGLLHLEVDLGVTSETALTQQLLEKVEQDCFGSEKQRETCLKFPCPKCSFTTTTEKLLRQHVYVNHLQPGQTRCDVCGRNYSNYYNLAYHLITHASQRPYKCGQCGNDFKRKHDLKLHRKNAHSEIGKKKDIEIRNKVEESKFPLKTQHPVSCETCRKGLQSRRALLQHQKWLHERPEKCELCGLRFHTQKALNHHRADKHPNGHKTHQPYELVLLGCKGEESWRCLCCGLVVSSTALADVHQLTHSTDSDKFQEESDAGAKKQQVLMFSCFKCDFSAPTEGRLITHLRLVHLKGTQTKCDLCEKKSTSAAYLADHLLSHSSYHPFKCACGLTFKRNKDFQTHLLSCAERNEQTKQKCPLCKYSAGSRSFLQNHIRVVHLKNRQKTCQLCQKTCLNPSLLARHLLSHPPFTSSIFKSGNDHQFSSKPGQKVIDKPRNSDKRAIADGEVCKPAFKSESPSFIGLYEAVEGPVPRWRCKFCNLTFTSRAGFFYSHLRSHQIQPDCDLQTIQHCNREEAQRPKGGTCSLDQRGARGASGDATSGQLLSESSFVCGLQTGPSKSAEQGAMSMSQPSPSISLPSVGEASEIAPQAVSKVPLDLLSSPGLGIQECWQRAKELLRNPVEKSGSELAVTDPFRTRVFRVRVSGAFLVCEESCPEFRLKYHCLFCCHTLAAARATRRLNPLLRAIREEIQMRQTLGNEK